jgi:RNA polymerase sigma factor (sigma-70 family)
MESATIELEHPARLALVRARRERVTVQSFAAEPRRSALLNAFPTFPRADVEDAHSFAIEQGLNGLCREESEASIRSWLTTVMLNKLLRQQRRRRRVVTASDAAVELEVIAGGFPSPEQAVITAERSRAIAELVDSLPRQTQDVLRARYFEGKTREQIARSYGLSAARVTKELRRGLDAVVRFAADQTTTGPCQAGRRCDVLAYARGHARRTAATARHHVIHCEQCRGFCNEFRGMRWGAAAAIPEPTTIGHGPGAGTALEKVVAGGDWLKQQLYALAGRGDPGALAAIRGNGTAATLLTCAAIGTAGSATYCATQGMPGPVRGFLGTAPQATDSKREREEPKDEIAVPPVATEPPAVPEAVPEPAPQPPPATPPPEPKPKPEEFGFEKTVPPSSGASSESASATASQPREPAPAPATGGGEFAP